MSLSGGLIQLISKNSEDNRLTKDPELFPFLKIYRKYTNFSIDDNTKNLGYFKKGNRFSTIINNVGDLLGNMNMVVTLSKKYIEKKIVNVQENVTFTDTLKIKLNNTSYFIITNSDNTKLILIPENFNEAYDTNYINRIIKLDLDIENKIFFNKLLSYGEIFLKKIDDTILNEINKFNNVREKVYLHMIPNLKGRKISVISEFFDEYIKVISNIFKFNYDFTFSKNLTNGLFNIDNNISLNSYINNLPISELRYDSIVLLDNIMSLLNYNNQRFNLMFHYEYNNKSNKFSIFGSNILDTVEWSNNQKVKLIFFCKKF